MVNQVVERDNLAEYTLAMAQKIATKPAFALKLRQGSGQQDTRYPGPGERDRRRTPFHHLGHNQNFRLFGWGMDPTNVPSLANVPKKT